MAITHNAIAGEQIVIDPADARGPWTIMLPPAPANSDLVIVKAITTSSAQVIVDGNGKQIDEPRLSVVETPAARSLPTLAANLRGRAVHFTFNAGRDQWNIFTDQRPIQELVLFDVIPILIDSTTPITIPLSFAGTPPLNNVWTINGSGQLVANLSTVERIWLDVHVFGETTLANNEDCIFILRISRLSGTGEIATVPAVAAFQTSRGSVYPLTANAVAVIKPLAGDIYEVTGAIELLSQPLQIQQGSLISDWP